MLRSALFLATVGVLSTSATSADLAAGLKSTDRILDGGCIYRTDRSCSEIVVDELEATQRHTGVLETFGRFVLIDEVPDSPLPPSPPPTNGGLYPSSVVGTDFDFITEDDPNAFQRLEYVGFMPFEMPDKRSNSGPLVQDAYVFNAYFGDGTKIGIAEDKGFGSKEAAEQDALRYTPRLGRLPSLYRQNLNHIVVHTGGADTTSFAEDKGHFFTIYAGNATKRIATHDLEETFFHESSHAAIQVNYLESAEWKNAEALDNAYVTDYAQTNEQEDFAETALFAYTLIYHPERIPAGERAKIEQQIPHRLAFFRKVFTTATPPPPSN